MSERELTEEAFNTFLSWLDPDREAAGRKYEQIRRRLVAVFAARGCERAEELADEALDRFTRRLPAMIDTFTGDPTPYIQAIASRVYMEYAKKRTRPLPENFAEPPAPEADAEGERLHECLEKCLGKLGAGSRALVLDYYHDERQAKIDFRKTLAERMGIAVNALRIRVHRIRGMLHACINDCLDLTPQEMD